MIHKKLVSVALLVSFIDALGQVSIPGQLFDIIDKVEDTTTLSLYPSIRPNQIEQLQWIDPLLKGSFNTKHPRGYNDGAVWKGNGLTFEGHGGFIGGKGKVSYTFFPVVYFSQNADYFLALGAEESGNKYAYQFSNNIDWVQQYGNGSFFAFHPGQSEIKVDWGKVITSLSTQNYSLGPSIYNPILLSRQAGGFPHLRLGTEPIDLKIRKKDIGKLEVNFLVGLLSESDYFDNDSNNDNRYFNSLSIAYSPSFLPELSVGLNKVLYKNTEYFEFEDILSTIYILDDGVIDDRILPNDAWDQMASIFMEWNLTESGFRAYAEFAKNDFTTSGDFRFFAIEPEHSRAYTIGFEKRVIAKNNKRVLINYEHTNLSRNPSFLYRATPTFYAHNINKQGYTHNGQIVGAGIGPGGNSDHLGVRVVGSAYDYGILIQRIEHNKDYFLVNIQDSRQHDIEYSFGLFMQKETEKVIFYGEGWVNHNYNRNWRINGDRTNFSFSLGTRLKLGQ